MQQLNNERQMIEKSRDDLMNEQRRIMGECYEERRKLTIEKQELQSSQSKFNKDNLERVCIELDLFKHLLNLFDSLLHGKWNSH